MSRATNQRSRADTALLARLASFLGMTVFDSRTALVGIRKARTGDCVPCGRNPWRLAPRPNPALPLGMGRETERQFQYRQSLRRLIVETLARLTDPYRRQPAAERVVSPWDKRRARGAEPLFHPTIGAAIRAGKPWLTFYSPGCQIVGKVDLRKLDRHHGATIGSLIPQLSCQRCSPHPPFARLIGLQSRPG